MDSTDNGDDFDSFFSTKKSKTPQKSSKISDPMEDLFGLDEKTSSPRKPQTKSTTSARIREEPEDDDDDLGFDPKKPKAFGKGQNLFDDLLAPLESKRPQTAGVSQAKPSISRQSTDTTTDTSNIFQTQAARPKTSQGRRTSNMSGTQNPDPLGLFSKDKETSKPSSTINSPKAQKRGTTADWLGLTKETEPEPPKATAPRAETPKITTTKSKETVEILKLPDTNDKREERELVEPEHEEPVAVRTTNPAASDTNFMVDTTSHNIMLVNSLNQETQQSFLALKYQEQQLIMASQMKQQERMLMEMQHKQETLLKQQEKQFQNLVQQQMQRHQQLEEVIKQQQQRINSHIQLMMMQPPAMEVAQDVEMEDKPQRLSKTKKQDPGDEENVQSPPRDYEKEKQLTLDLIQFESDNRRLELENLRLEEVVANTKSNYEKEIELLERSYKKQIEVLEEHLSTVEKRLKTELEDIQNHFQTKIEVLEQEKQTLKKNYEEELANLKQDHEDDLRKLRKNQEEDLEMLKEEHRRMLDNIRQAKMLEFAAVQENGSYLDCLKVASSNLTDLTGSLNELRANMSNKIELMRLEREKKLEQREKTLEDNERRLKITEEANETEKQRLMELVSTLELQMTKMSKETAEENWQLRQKLASIDAEKLAFNKEKEFFREQMLRDEERIKDLKELQLMETQKLQVVVQEERAQLQVEKSKFELEKRLQSNNDVEKDRLEVEAAMQVAHDAARKADLERERFYKMQRQLEQQKRDLSDKDHALSVREEELHQELLSYRMAERVAQESHQKAKMAEQFYQNKLKLLQQRSNEIAEKEANLSQERLLLAQDRIAIHALKTKLSQQPKCSLCQLSQKNREITQSLQASNVAETSPLTNLLKPEQAQDQFDFLQQPNVVERFLDANIADSLRRMQANANYGLDWENLLDDDHKTMVQNDEFDVANSTNIPRTNL